MDLSAIFLGTAGAVPTARRSTAAVLVIRGGERLLFDCGEGTQRQLQRSLGLVQIKEIYLTHYHADHILGLPGLLKTYELTERQAPITVYGPPGLRTLFANLSPLIGKLGYEVELVELEPGDAVPHAGYAVRVFGVRHNARASGYALVEEPRPGRFDPAAARRLGVPEGPAFALLQRGEAVSGTQGSVHPEQVMGAARAGRALVLSGDTRPCQATVDAARGAELLIHDASFTEEDAGRAAQTGHSTAEQAAAVARDAAVKLLALTHISSRYHVAAVLAAARAIHSETVAPRDFDTIELPLPERGPPLHLSGGARRSSRPVSPSTAGLS